MQLERQDKNYPMEYDGLAGKIYFTLLGEGVRTLLVPTPQAKNMLASNAIAAEL
ncbi:MAG: hypothetical protein IPI00_06510 [Flavobacteriales bacterium]|nr:hypothetical protein [Flavobacteriales bacterium]